MNAQHTLDAHIPYDAPVSRELFELHPASDPDTFAPTPLTAATPLVERIRDAAFTRLREALPELDADIERCIVGRSPDGARIPTEHRVRLVPLPSIGHPHADRCIRRVLVEVPTGIPLRADDIFWAFSGLMLPGTPEIVLVRATDRDMLDHYGIHPPARTWRTVTAAALPETAARRRVEPSHRAEQPKGGPERTEEETRAASAVLQALRHANIRAHARDIRVQREPFDNKGARAEAFAPDTRFSKERLWHVEITFQQPISGPLILGDGRYLGLGVMAPAEETDSVFAFTASGLSERSDPFEIASSMRRAVMARVQATLEGESLPPFFTGHEGDGTPAKTHPHLLFLFDAKRSRILVIAPHLAERREPRPSERRYLAWLAEALVGLTELRAGRSGLLALQPTPIDLARDPLFSPSTVWESQTSYLVTRHAKGTTADEALATDLRAECRRRGLPEPTVTPLGLRGVPGTGLVGGARLTFPIAVPGPIVLGRSRHRGGGLFTAARGD